MPGLVRKKRISDEPDTQDAPATTSTLPGAPSRRATRQSSTAPLPTPEDPEPRRRRRRVESEAEEELPVTLPLRKSRALQGKENVPLTTGENLPKATRSTRHSGGLETGVAENLTPSVPSQPAPASLPVPTVPHRSPVAPRPVGRPPGRPSGHAQTVPPNQSVTVGRNKPITMATSGSQPGHPASKTDSVTATKTSDRKSAIKNTQTDRNIDKVVLGDLCFKTWYPSYFGKEVLDNGPGTLDRLYVCDCCFKYSKELVAWWQHVQLCRAKNFIPGSKIYTHPKGQRTVLKACGPPPKSGRGRKSNASQKMVEELVQDQGEWSIWEVDGEVDVLFCQNLSLFAKLFLDNKSVFFDVTGFKYFLLVYTTPAVPAPSLPTPPEHPSSSSGSGNAPRQPRSQVVGFFSKEKMSWDNNNLACILVFPPWQRKGLGSLLMGVSYEISKREGVLGGPEKPISELGKKGYKRFWGNEIAMWLLSIPPTSSGAIEDGQEVATVDVYDCSKATWIVPEDCLMVLRDMGVVEDAGVGPVVKHSALGTPAELEGLTGAPVPAPDGVANNEKEGTPQQEEPVAHQRRVMIRHEAVMEWVKKNRISLKKPCDPNGFVEGYAMKKENDSAAAEESG